MGRIAEVLASFGFDIIKEPEGRRVVVVSIIIITARSGMIKWTVYLNENKLFYSYYNA